MKLCIFSIFWSNDNEERLKNATFSHKKITTLKNFIQKNQIKCEYIIFDFSVEKKIDGAIHMPYDLNKYERSKKMNIALDYINKNLNPDIICQFDSDIFITNNDFFKFIDLVKNIQKNDFYIANVLDIQKESMSLVDFVGGSLNTNGIKVKNRTITGLGAFFIIYTSNLLNVGGFDERFTIWGGEDDDLADRLLRKGMKRFVCNFNFLHLYHEPLSSNIELNPQYQKQLEILKTDKSIVRPTLINDYLQKNTEGLFSCNGLELLTPMRFDIPAKIFYAKNRKFNSEYPKKLYLEHIRVWNNFFEDTPPKRTKEDFLNHFNNLLENFEKHGFLNQNENFIPLKMGSPYNGAHRVAASIVTNTKVFAKDDDSNGQFDCSYNFFKKRGLSEGFTDEIALEYIRNKKNTFSITIFSSDKKNIDYAEKLISEHTKIIYSKEIEFTEIGKKNYIIELYRFEPWVGNSNNNFEGSNTKMKNCFKNSNKIRLYLVESDNFENLIKCKKTVREFYKEENHSIHINDTYEETWRISSTLLNKNSLYFINNFSQPKFTNFNLMIDKYKNFLLDKNKEHYCVTSSAVGSACSIRDCEDIDFLTIDPNYLNFKSSEISSHESQIKYYHKSKDEIILNPEYHFYYQGLKFSTLKILQNMKVERNEPKDVQDVEKINFVPIF